MAWFYCIKRGGGENNFWKFHWLGPASLCSIFLSRRRSVLCSGGVLVVFTDKFSENLLNFTSKYNINDLIIRGFNLFWLLAGGHPNTIAPSQRPPTNYALFLSPSFNEPFPELSQFPCLYVYSSIYIIIFLRNIFWLLVKLWILYEFWFLFPSNTLIAHYWIWCTHFIITDLSQLNSERLNIYNII